MNRFIAVGALGLPLIVLATQAQTPAPIDREYTLESTMLGYRGVGGEIDGVRNPTLWARTGETVRITIVNGELMVHDITLEKHNVTQRADSRQRRDLERHVQGERERHLLLLASRPPRRGHGRPPRGLRPAARAGRRSVVPDGERPAAQPRFRDRHAGGLDGDRRRLRARQGRHATRRISGARSPARTGSAAAWPATRARARCRPRRFA